MPSYKICSPVKVNGRIMKSGVVTLDTDVAEPLLESGALRPAEAETAQASQQDTDAPAEPAPAEPQASATKSTTKSSKAKG